MVLNFEFRIILKSRKHPIYWLFIIFLFRSPTILTLFFLRKWRNCWLSMQFVFFIFLGQICFFCNFPIHFLILQFYQQYLLSFDHFQRVRYPIFPRLHRSCNHLHQTLLFPHHHPHRFLVLQIIISNFWLYFF